MQDMTTLVLHSPHPCYIYVDKQRRWNLDIHLTNGINVMITSYEQDEESINDCTSFIVSFTLKSTMSTDMFKQIPALEHHYNANDLDDLILVVKTIQPIFEDEAHAHTKQPISIQSPNHFLFPL